VPNDKTPPNTKLKKRHKYYNSLLLSSLHNPNAKGSTPTQCSTQSQAHRHKLNSILHGTKFSLKTLIKQLHEGLGWSSRLDWLDLEVEVDE
jgi:hypothetical protein